MPMCTIVLKVWRVAADKVSRGQEGKGIDGARMCSVKDLTLGVSIF